MSRRLLVARLRELANGATPDNPNIYGICRDIGSVVGDEAESLFKRALGGEENPLGDYYVFGNLWDGERGRKRRILAGLMAAAIEAGDLP